MFFFREFTFRVGSNPKLTIAIELSDEMGLDPTLKSGHYAICSLELAIYL